MKEEKGKAISKSWIVAGVAARSKGLGGQCDGLMHLLAQQAMMMIMRMMIHTTRES